MQNKDCLSYEFENNVFLDILSSYVCEKEFKCDKSQLNTSYLINLSFEQGLGGFMYKAGIAYNIFTECEIDKLKYYYEKSLFLCAARNESISRICQVFEENKIDFLILKGAILQKYYPSPELRVMSDVDFFIKENSRFVVKDILRSIGIKFKESNSYQDIYEDCNGLLIEIHHALWGYNLDDTKLVSAIWDEKNLSNGWRHMYTLPLEDQYIFLISHMFKHFSDSGIGIRPLFDIWFFLKKNVSCLDFIYIKSELAKFKSVEFEKKIRNVVNCIFIGKEKNNNDKLIISYLLKCKTHGTARISTANAIGNNNKAIHVFSKLFPSFSYMKRRYRILNKIPLLLPFLWVARFLSFIFNKEKIDNNLEKIKSSSVEEREYVSNVMIAAGIAPRNAKTKSIIFFALIILCLFSIVFCAIFFRNGNGSYTNLSENKSENLLSNISIEIDSSLSDQSQDSEISSEYFESYDTIEWKSGIYTGFLKDGIPNGSGKHEVPDKQIIYIGAFVDGEYDGIGKIQYPDGSYYEGSFSQSQLNGEGSLYCANGDIISGTFSNGQPGGFCNYQYSDGHSFIGTMIEGKKHGEGTFYWSNGDKYVGSFINDMRDGYGVIYYSNGDECSGTWEKNFLNGYGVYTWSDGRKYEGYFENNMLNDTSGKIIFSDGSFFVGEVKNGLQDGVGEITFANGDIAKGTFVKGYLNGEADYYYASNSHWGKVIYEKGVIIKYILN